MSLRLLVIIVIPIFSSVAVAESRVVGQTYEVVEPDPYTQIAERASKIDMGKIRDAALERLAFLETMRADQLPRALSSSERFIRPSAMSPADIQDKDGNVVYPKGYQFNPLEFRKLSGRIVVFDAADVGQLQFEQNDTLILNNGDIKQVGATLQRPVFILDRFTADALSGLRAVPTVIEQQGNQLRYKEFVFKEAVDG